MAGSLPARCHELSSALSEREPPDPLIGHLMTFCFRREAAGCEAPESPSAKCQMPDQSAGVKHTAGARLSAIVAFRTVCVSGLLTPEH